MVQGERPGGAGIPDTALCPPLPPSGPLPLSPGDGSLPSTLAVEVGQFGNRVAGGAPGCLSSSSSVTSTGPAPPSLGAPPPPGGVMLPPSNTDLRAFGCKTRPVQLPLSANTQDLTADKGDGSFCPLLPVCQPEWDLAKLDEKAQSLPGWTPRSDALCGILPGAPG